MSEHREYKLLLRDLAESAPRCDFDTIEEVPELSNEQAAVILKAFPDLLAEALAGRERQYADMMSLLDTTQEFDLVLIAFVTTQLRAIRELARTYIWKDLREMAPIVTNEAEQDAQYERGYRD